jgi:dethiobiotin synthetase
MGKGFFVTGTDTGVGKTLVAGGLIGVLKERGVSVCGMKPVESGCSLEGGAFVPEDGLFLRKMSGVREHIENITPYRLRHPLAPSVAAELEGVEIDPVRIMEAFRRLGRKYESVVVEGVGGLMVPVRGDYFVLDMAGDFGLPVIVVASPFLGTVNHTLLTVETALQRGLAVAGVLLNYQAPPTGSLAEETNPRVLKDLLPVPFLGVLPHAEGMDGRRLIDAIKDNLDLNALMSSL